MSDIRFFVEGNVKQPSRKKEGAGIDLYVPNISEEFIRKLGELNPGTPFTWGILGAPTDEEAARTGKGIYIYVQPGEDILVPTYVRARCPKNIVLRVADKSGVAVKQKIHYGAGVIDWNYEGEIIVQLFNPTNKLIFLEFGQGLCQILPEIIDTSEIEVFYDKNIEEYKEFRNLVTKEEFFDGNDKTRGEDGFGSSDTE